MSAKRSVWPYSFWLSLLLVALCSVLIPIKQAEAASVPTGFQDQRVATGLTSPTATTVLPDNRVLVVQQNGVVRIIKNDVMLGTPFYSVPSVNTTGEHGCIGITPDPDFSTNRFVYLHCTINNASGNNSRILRITATGDTAGSQTTIFELPNNPGGNRFHSGGAIRFGADGMLYIASGNREDSPQNPSNSQRLTNPFGKILRITKTGGIPSDNPHAGRTDSGRSIWALGFRNPFALDIQPGTGRIFATDVGQEGREEINDVVRGANYGWPFFEGTTQRIAPPGGFSHRAPFFHYASRGGGRCAITGVSFYNPAAQQFPEVYRGKFFYQDFCGGIMRRIDPTSTAGGRGDTGFATGLSFPTNVAIAPNGSLYYMERNQNTGTPTNGGRIGKITFTASQAPRCSVIPEDATVTVGNSHTFTAGADGADSLQWQRADVLTPTNFSNIAGATGTSFTIASAQLSDNGDKFRMVATNAFGSTNCGPATLTVTQNRAPTAIIDAPVSTLEFVTGQTIPFSGRGTDPDDGTVPTARKTWAINWQHDAHPHPQMFPTTGIDGGNFVVPDLEGTEANVWIRFFLTVEDSGGLTHTTTRDIFPSRQISSMTPTSSTNGLGPIERDQSNGGGGAGDGTTITIAGLPYLKGLGVHAPSDVRYNVTGCTGNFVADVGVDDEVGDLGSVQFQVFLDGQQVFNSGTVVGSDNKRVVLVPVSGRSELRLVVTDAGDGNSSDHASWGGARVTGCTGAPPGIISNLNVRDTANAADWSIRSNIQAGDQTFGDRTYTLVTVPSSVAGSAWIRPAADSKGFPGNPLVSFSVSETADVFVALDNRVVRPSWLDGTWVDTGEDIVNRETATVTQTLSLFRKRFTAGTVSLGPQGTTGAPTYLVIAKPAGGTPTLSITNLNVRDTANAADWSARSNLQNGNQAFGDRAYTFSNVGSFAGSAWIRTAADSKGFTGNPLVSFSINIDADVFVAIDDRISPRPPFLDTTWTDTGINVNTLEGTTTRTQSVFSKRFSAGTVSLGPQASSTAANYSIFVRP